MNENLLGIGEKSKKIKQMVVDVELICETANVLFTRKEMIKDYVEVPLLKACEQLYDKNIKTISSSATPRDVEAGKVNILIDYDSLSEENKNITKKIGEIWEVGGHKMAHLNIPVNSDSAVEEISMRALEIVEEFQKQKPTWFPKYTLDYLQKYQLIDPDITEKDNLSELENAGFYYDPKEKVFYVSLEHRNKATE